MRHYFRIQHVRTAPNKMINHWIHSSCSLPTYSDRQYSTMRSSYLKGDAFIWGGFIGSFDDIITQIKKCLLCRTRSGATRVGSSLARCYGIIGVAAEVGRQAPIPRMPRVAAPASWWLRTTQPPWARDPSFPLQPAPDLFPLSHLSGQWYRTSQWQT